MDCTYKDLFNSIEKLTEDNKPILLNNFKMNELLSIIISDENYENYQNNLNEVIILYQNLRQALSELKIIMENPVFDNADLSKEYDKLEEGKKLNAALDMLNNPTFQKNCCRILTEEYKSVVESDSTMKMIDNLLGIGKYFEKAIKTGIGCNHQYGKRK